ncbi:4-hydroxy-tetrahydrodipicolinate synthase [Kaistia sp. 32K]|uniref:4-hydroxy-tetrahydrodipicolinate synthase n=1 Tax=Kaistia sp. 32K TaxID=2795690 RepID=UPI0019162BA6|nr:4-hydroxy-tetrahydrodipicolinate synthase [Kaistia sp. 32K]BCP54419.1 4-hydroxy-tetrahydrodipicolinate synthase [Kaistia sp. 32K]
MKDVIPRGSMTALVTPFKRDGIDERAFGDFVAWQVRKGTDGLVPCGVAGEGSTLTEAERDRLIRIAVEAASRRPVIAATGSNSTEKTIARTRDARLAGADAVLVVTPYYNRPSQEGLFQHFAALAAAVDIPILLENAPDRTGVSLTEATLERLRRIPSIVGIVASASGGTAPALRPDASRPDFACLAGRDELAVQHHALGGSGAVSAIANLLPGVSAAIQEACRQHDLALASALHRQILPLLVLLDREPEPVAIKYAVSCLRPGFNPAPRLPLAPPAEASMRAIEAAVAHLVDTPEGFAEMILHGDRPGSSGTERARLS